MLTEEVLIALPEILAAEGCQVPEWLIQGAEELRADGAERPRAG